MAVSSLPADSNPKQPLVVIVGETASGKSVLALELAEKYNGEIICADSWTVYKGFDIGTAKPSAAEQTRVRHHLLDVTDPADGFSAVLFQKLANEAIEDIISRGKVPFLVGGTGLYIDSVIFDYSFLPPSSPELRTELNSLSLEAILARAVELGLDTTDIDLRNKRRVIRLIENNGVRPSRTGLRPNTVILGLQTDREKLQAKIEARVSKMLTQGLETEVAQLVKAYGWKVEPMKGIGYREWQDYFAGQQTLAETEQKIIKSTLDLAKRQRTWFRRSAYADLPASDQSFSATTSLGSIDVRPGTPQPPNQHRPATRNKSIQWLDNSDAFTQADAILTTYFNNL